MDCIFLVLERIDYYAVVLRSRLMPALAERFKVVILTPDIDDAAVARYGYHAHPNLIYRKIQVRYPKVWDISDRLRRYFVRGYDHLWTTQDGFYLYPKNLVERFLVAFGALAPKRVITPGFFTAIESLAAPPSREFQDLVRHYRPKLIVTSTPGYRHLPLTAECIIFAGHLGIPTVAVYQSFDNPYSMPKFLRKTDYIFVWSDTMKREAITFHHYAPGEVRVVGSLKFDHHFFNVNEHRIKSREEFLESKNLDPEKKTVVYCTTTPGFKVSRGLMAAIVTMKRTGLLKGDPNLLVRLHPHEFWSPYEDFRNIPGVHIERAGSLRDERLFGPKIEMEEIDLINQTETFLYADVLVNFSSTTTLEACILDTPVASIGWPERLQNTYRIEVSKALLETGVERNARNPKELAEFINAFLENPALDREQRAWVVKHYLTFRDGLAYQRTADAISEIARLKESSLTKSGRI